MKMQCNQLIDRRRKKMKQYQLPFLVDVYANQIGQQRPTIFRFVEKKCIQNDAKCVVGARVSIHCANGYNYDDDDDES